jgi:hypothetical protein
MTDLVERLRARANDKFIRDYPLIAEAADEIERLSALKTPASRQLLNITKGCLDNAEGEVEELRAVNEFDTAIQYVLRAEKLADPGTYQYDLYVKAALMVSWPAIKAFAEMRRATSAGKSE